jgi:hypothetical protein
MRFSWISLQLKFLHWSFCTRSFLLLRLPIVSFEGFWDNQTAWRAVSFLEQLLLQRSDRGVSVRNAYRVFNCNNVIDYLGKFSCPLAIWIWNPSRNRLFILHFLGWRWRSIVVISNKKCIWKLCCISWALTLSCWVIRVFTAVYLGLNHE